jgi:SAM-dependent methyltransferase
MTSQVERDFDRIALLPDEAWDHNRHYHALLLRELPPRCERALEIGCGTGELSRLLAARSRSVLAIDLSPNMIRLARERSRGVPNLEFRVADAATWEIPRESFECVASIATLHHLDTAATLARMRDALALGGTLLVLDLFRASGPGDLAASALAAPLNVLLRLAKTGRPRARADVRRAWEEHGRHDRYPTVAEVRALCARLLPGARVRRHLFWRYSIVWRRSAGAAGLRDETNVPGTPNGSR